MEKQNKKPILKEKQQEPQSDKKTVVPKDLNKLIKLLCRAFYEPELIIVVNALLAWHCVERQDLELLLQYSKNGMEAALNTLEADRIIKRKKLFDIKNNTQQEAWHVNYKEIVNIIIFKLYKVQSKIDEEQKLATSRASFTCVKCGKVFTELHMDRLMGPDFFINQTLTCTHCGGVVEENQKDDASDKRSLAEQFNLQRKAFDDCLEKLKGVRLHEDLCNPQKTEKIPHIERRKMQQKEDIQASKDRVQDLRKGLISPINGFGDGMNAYGENGFMNNVGEIGRMWREGRNYDDSKMYNNNLQIEILSYAEQRKKQILANQVAKEVPTWMRVSTVKGAEMDAEVRKEENMKNLWDDWFDEDDDEDMFDDDEEIKAGGGRKTTGGGRWAQKKNEEVQKMCFQYEKKNQGEDDSDDDDSDSDDDMNYEISFPEDYFESIHNNSISYRDILMQPSLFHLLSQNGQQEFRRYLKHDPNNPNDKIVFLTNIS